ncbi:MAG: serine/threonine-protein kinase [Planctomycetota bacterium]
MSASRLQQEMQLFAEALERPPAARSAFLEDKCPDDPAMRSRVMSLLSSHDRVESDGPTAETAAAPRPNLPAVIGPYRITSRLGEGGMGVVYAAEQTHPVRRRVAVKVLKFGQESEEILARFHAERQALALMNHANIARMLDAGVHDGRPYFVMELIQGVPITRYCDKRMLPIEDRLELFSRVCDGVHHAHQKGVIHRDLKPSNILVTEEDDRPVPKIIDFGIAKAVTPRLLEATVHTEMGRIIGTPDYMSPEQADGGGGMDIDTRADVYSLGALLHELLSGTTVFGLFERGAGIDEARQAIAHRTPPKASDSLLAGDAEKAAANRSSTPESLARTLRRDLDWITRKALEKDRLRRYPSASEMASDVQRFLQGDAVIARPPSASYRVGKFVNRNRGSVAAGVVVAVSLVAAVFISVFSAIEAARQRADAQETARELERVAEFESRRLLDVVPEEMGLSIENAIGDSLEDVNFTTVAMAALRENIFDNTLAAIEEEFDNEPLLKARLLHSSANTMLRLGLVEPALAPQQESVKIRAEILGEQDLSTVESRVGLGDIYRELGRFDDAAEIFEETLAKRSEMLGADHPDTIHLTDKHAHNLHQAGRLEEAEPIYREALKVSTRALGPDDEQTGTILNNLGYLLAEQGRNEEALAYLTDGLRIARRTLEPTDPKVLAAVANIGGVLIRQDKLDEATGYFKEALDGFRHINGDEHPLTLTMLSNTGFLLQQQGKLDEAKPYYQESLDVRSRVLGPDHPETLVSASNLANLLMRQDEDEQARELYERVYRVRMKTLGPDHFSTINSAISMAQVERKTGHPDLALALTTEVLDVMAEQHPEGHRLLRSSLAQHARTLHALDRFTEAETYALRALEESRARLGLGHSTTIRSLQYLVELYTDWAKTDPEGDHLASAEKWRQEKERAEAGEH